MEAGQILLILSTMIIIFDILLLFGKSSRKQKYRVYISILAFLTILATYLSFVQAFISDNFSIVEVYSHSSSSLPFLSKIYASWAGGGGSLLLLTLCLGVFYISLRLWAAKKPEEHHIVSSRIMAIITAFFILMCIAKNPFATFEATTPQEGGGLNPTLQTPWMSVHPPIVFIAYAFLTLAFVLVLANMRTGKQTEQKLLKLSIQTSWLFFTIGIALGGLWAYEVLGWGGYWSWDPIETTSLLPWLALTAYFHLNRKQENKKVFSKELMILLAFDAVIFLSALTRGGLLMSVHAYAFSPAGPVLLLFALAVTAYFFYLQRKTRNPLLQLSYDKTSTESLSIFIGVLSILAMFIVCFTGVAAPLIQSVFTTEPYTPGTGFYNIANLPFVTALLAAFILRILPGKVTAKTASPIIILLAISIILVAIQWPTNNWLANLALPFVTVGLAALIWQLARTIAKKTRSIHSFGSDLLHLGLALTLIGVFISAGATQTAQAANLNLEQPNQILDVQITVSNPISEISTSEVELSDGIYPEYIALQMDAEIQQAGNTYDTVLTARLYPALGIVIAPSIVRTPTGDIYIHIEQSDALTNSLMTAASGNFTAPEKLTLTVRTIPWINLVWAGSTMLSIGIAVTLARTLTTPTPQASKRKQKEISQEKPNRSTRNQEKK